MKIKLPLVIVCLLAFSLGAPAQRLNNSYSRDTVSKDGNIIISENIRTELQKIPIPAGAQSHLHFYKRILNAALHQKEIAVCRRQMNWFFQLENQIRLYRYDSKNNEWNPSAPVRYENNYTITYIMILLIISTFFAAQQSKIKVSELLQIVFLNVLIILMSLILFITLSDHFLDSFDGITKGYYLLSFSSFVLSIIGLAFLSALAIFSGRAFSRKEETDENLTWV